MLDCNITEALYSHVRKEQFGVCSNVDTLLSMSLNEMRINFGCSDVVVCYTPETCDTNVISCSYILTQDLTSTSCSFTLIQTFDDP